MRSHPKGLSVTGELLKVDMANQGSAFKGYLSAFARQGAKPGPDPEVSSVVGATLPDSEEEILARTLPDYLRPNLDILIVGINPGYMSAKEGHYYAGHGNHLWKCMYEAGLLRFPVDWRSDAKLLEWDIGLTNLISRATRSQSDLTMEDYRKGSQELREKIYEFKPKILVFNGRKIYEIFCGTELLYFGLQKSISSVQVYVMPSTSPRSSLYPRAEDKLPYFKGLKLLYDHVKHGHQVDVDQLRFKPRRKNARSAFQGSA